MSAAPSPSVSIRPARREDLPRILELIQALASFEKLPGPTDDAAARLAEDAFGPRPRIEVSVGELGGIVVAYAICFETYSTFLCRPTLFLEDLFVHPDARGRGVATAILAHLEAVARARGCGRFEWMVLDWNTGAQALYERLGARRHDDWRLYRRELIPPG